MARPKNPFPKASLIIVAGFFRIVWRHDGRKYEAATGIPANDKPAALRLLAATNAILAAGGAHFPQPLDQSKAAAAYRAAAKADAKATAINTTITQAHAEGGNATIESGAVVVNNIIPDQSAAFLEFVKANATALAALSEIVKANLPTQQPTPPEAKGKGGRPITAPGTVTQKQAAELLGVEIRTLQNWDQGISRPGGWTETTRTNPTEWTEFSTQYLERERLKTASAEILGEQGMRERKRKRKRNTK